LKESGVGEGRKRKGEVEGKGEWEVRKRYGGRGEWHEGLKEV